MGAEEVLGGEYLYGSKVEKSEESEAEPGKK